LYTEHTDKNHEQLCIAGLVQRGIFLGYFILFKNPFMKFISGILTLFFFPAIFLLGSPGKVSQGSDPVQITGHILTMENGGFLMGPAKMTLYLDTANFGSKVEGSPWYDEYTKEFRPFGLEEEKTSRKFINDYVAMRERVGSNPGGLQEDSLNFLYGQYEYFKRLKDKNYINSKPDSDVSLALARNMFRSGVSFEEINEVFNLLSLRQKESIIGQELYRKVKAAKETGVGSVAPDFSLQDSSGTVHSLASFRGKYVLVDFWKYGCIPCIEQFPILRELYAGYQTKGFEILGVFHCVFEGDRKNWREWMNIVQKERPTWTGLIDYEDAVCQAYGVEAFPSNVLQNQEH
jgi:peroxiredoxin